jgi:aspartate/methionine/tyrosine aminotransferase
MLRVATHGSSLAVAEAMLERGVITVPGASFGSEGEGFVRVSFCADQRALTEGVRRMAEALAASSPRQEQPV